MQSITRSREKPPDGFNVIVQYPAGGQKEITGVDSGFIADGIVVLYLQDKVSIVLVHPISK